MVGRAVRLALDHRLAHWPVAVQRGRGDQGRPGALRHLEQLTPLIIRHNEIVPNVVAAELMDEGSGLNVAVGEEATTVEEVCEPFLVRAGMIARTPRGRVATSQAWTHLGMTPPSGVTSLGQPGLFE